MLTYGSELQKATAVQSFWNGYYGTPSVFNGLYYDKTSTQKTDTYARLGAAPMPEEWTADRNAKDVNEYSVDVTNVPYDATVSVDKELILYQQWDEVAGVIRSLGEKARAHQDKLASALIEAGISTVCEDGQFFFDDDHVDPGAANTTSQVNDTTTNITTPAAPTDLEMAALIRVLFGKFWTFKDDQGDPMVPKDSNPNDFVLMVPPEHRSVALQILNNNQITGPIGNELMGQFVIEVNPYFTLDTTDYLFYRGSPHKPVIKSESMGLVLTDDLDPKSGNTNYSATWHGKMAYGQWRTAVVHIST